jgi:hypothetical protein
LDDFVDIFISIVQEFFPLMTDDGQRKILPVKGKTPKIFNNNDYESILEAQALWPFHLSGGMQVTKMMPEAVGCWS